MFIGVGAMSAGGVAHLYTHAFFKALLFLTAGSVMHALAGQLDIRTMGGLRRKMPVTALLMLAGCLALAGTPFITAGFYSKDEILGDAMAVGVADWRGLGWVYTSAAWIGLFTAGLTAFYTFRLWFRVFCGPERFEMGEEHGHANDSHAAAVSSVEADAAEVGHADHHGHEPHEMPWWPMNGPLVLLALGSLFGFVLWSLWLGAGYADGLLTDVHAVESHLPGEHAAAGAAHGLHHQELFGIDAHQAVALIASLLALAGIALAAFFHLFQTGLRDRLAGSMGSAVGFLRRAWMVDTLYDRVIVTPLRLLAELLHGADGLLIGGFFGGLGAFPSWAGRSLQPAQSGRLQNHAVWMVGGLAALALLLIFAVVYLQPASGVALHPPAPSPAG